MRGWGIAAAIVLLVVTTGCREENKKVAVDRPIVLGEKPQNVSTYAQRIVSNATQPKTVDLKAKKMELEAQKEIARLQAQKELEIARLKAEAEKSKVLSEKELTLKKIQMQLEQIVGDRKMVGWVIALSAIFLFVLLWVVVKLFREYHAHKKRLEEAKMRHEKELKEKEMQARLAEKMFEALGSGHLDKEQQNRLLDAIGQGVKHLPMKRE